MKMSSSISVSLSADDTLRSKRCKMVDHLEWFKVAALGVCEESIFGSESERHVTNTRKQLILYCFLGGVSVSCWGIYRAVRAPVRGIFQNESFLPPSSYSVRLPLLPKVRREST